MTFVARLRTCFSQPYHNLIIECPGDKRSSLHTGSCIHDRLSPRYTYFSSSSLLPYRFTLIHRLARHSRRVAASRRLFPRLFIYLFICLLLKILFKLYSGHTKYVMGMCVFRVFVTCRYVCATRLHNVSTLSTCISSSAQNKYLLLTFALEKRPLMAREKKFRRKEFRAASSIRGEYHFRGTNTSVNRYTDSVDLLRSSPETSVSRKLRGHNADFKI